MSSFEDFIISIANDVIPNEITSVKVVHGDRNGYELRGSTLIIYTTYVREPYSDMWGIIETYLLPA